MEASGPIALIELGTSHEDILHAQVRFLQSHGYRVHLVVAGELVPRLPAVGADLIEVLPPLAGGWGRLRGLLRLRDYLRRHGIRAAVLNTAEGARVRDFCLLAGGGVELAGIVHNAGKLVSGSVTQRLIGRRVSRFLVLNDAVADFLHERGFARPVAAVYPVFFPDADRREPDRSDGRLRIVIPGSLERKRRDYLGLLDAVSGAGLPDSVRLVMLGNSRSGDGPEIRRAFEASPVRDRCVFFDGFVPAPVFYGELAAADLVAPLIHPATPGFDGFRRDKISGTFLLAQGYRKPMLMHRAFASMTDFRETAVFHEMAELGPLIRRLADDRSLLERPARAAAAIDKFRFEVQAGRYVGFLRGVAEPD